MADVWGKELSKDHRRMLLIQSAFLYNLGPLPRGGTTCSELVPPTSVINQEHTSQGNPLEAVSQLTLLSQVTPLLYSWWQLSSTRFIAFDFTLERAPCFLSLLSPSTQDHRPLPYQSVIQKMLCRLAYRPFLWKHLLNWECYQNDPSSHKLTNTESLWMQRRTQQIIWSGKNVFK